MSGDPAKWGFFIWPSPKLSKLSKVGIFEIGPVLPKLWAFEILMFFERIGPKNSWSFAVGTSTECHSFISEYFHLIFCSKVEGSMLKTTEFFTGDLWTLVNRCYKETCFLCAFKHDNILNIYYSNSAISIDFIFLCKGWCCAYFLTLGKKNYVNVIVHIH